MNAKKKKKIIIRIPNCCVTKQMCSLVTDKHLCTWRKMTCKENVFKIFSSFKYWVPFFLTHNILLYVISKVFIQFWYILQMCVYRSELVDSIPWIIVNNNSNNTNVVLHTTRLGRVVTGWLLVRRRTRIVTGRLNISTHVARNTSRDLNWILSPAPISWWNGWIYFSRAQQF